MEGGGHGRESTTRGGFWLPIFEVHTGGGRRATGKRRCPEKSAFDIMLGAAAVKDRLPQERSGNSKDRLYNDVLKHLKVSTKKKNRMTCQH